MTTIGHINPSFENLMNVQTKRDKAYTISFESVVFIAPDPATARDRKSVV